MIALLSIVILSLSGMLVETTDTRTNCDPPVSNDTCYQAGCSKFPCKMLCGHSAEYDSCRQDCYGGLFCDLIDCRAAEYCRQSCDLKKCGSLLCDAKNCSQTCYGPDAACSTLRCLRSATKCRQVSLSGAMICEGKSCRQDCPGGECNMTCAPGVENCFQAAPLGFVKMICEADVCTQACPSGECNMTCSSNVRECWQVCGGSGGRCLVECNAGRCTLDCPGGLCTIVKSPSTTKPSGGAWLQGKAWFVVVLAFAVKLVLL